jgi:pimeloyl-ACP methyl ester carboxylesterase
LIDERSSDRSVHGFASSFEHGWKRYGWNDLLVDAGRPVVGVDLLGHGITERPHEPSAYDDLGGHTLNQFPDEPVDVIAFSLGPLVTLRLAASYPKRFVPYSGSATRPYQGGSGECMIKARPHRCRTLRTVGCGLSAARRTREQRPRRPVGANPSTTTSVGSGTLARVTALVFDRDR